MPVKITITGREARIEGDIESEEDLRILSVEDFVHFTNFMIHENVKKQDLEKFYKVIASSLMTKALEDSADEKDLLLKKNNFLNTIRNFIKVCKEREHGDYNH